MSEELQDLGYAEFIAALERDAEARVRLEQPREGVARLVLCDEENQNALGGPLTVELQRKLGQALADPAARVVVLTGEGPFFSVGGDWKLMKDRAHNAGQRDEGSYGLWQWIRRQFGGIARAITQSDKPVVVGLNGDAAGVALAWTLCADLVVAASRARLVPAFGRIGLVPEVGTNWALSRRLGHAKAFELFVTGEPVSAQAAADLGLVNEVVDDGDLSAALDRWCERILRVPEHALAMAKPLLRNAADMSWHQAILAEEFAEPMTFTTRAHRQAIEELLRGEQKALTRSDG